MGNKSGVMAGSVLGDWTLTELIDSGGNGDVWAAHSNDGVSVAIKVLRNLGSEPLQRFQNEIEALRRNPEIPGIIPLISYQLPELGKKEPRWYAMPLAAPSSAFLKGKTPEEIVRHYIALAETLATLHERGIAHRDIKPANILALDERLCLSDFGLVKLPKSPSITQPRRDIGPKFTMAPEMRRTASTASGQSADVYSFAKSLWIALTGVELGFDGQYSAEADIALRHYLGDVYTTTLDNLLVECTQHEPLARPQIADVRDKLLEWLEIIADFLMQNARQWEELLFRFFPLAAPARVIWTELESIAAVLDHIGHTQGLNHMFYPDGGGNTIKWARLASEEGFIALGLPRACLAKPKRLSFESFGAAAEWNYFRLEVETVDPTGIYEVSEDAYYEYLTEIKPGEYLDANRWDYQYDFEDPLPPEARPVTRVLHGSFVIFSTSSLYNQTSDTYDGRHEAMTEEEFRGYIGRSAAHSVLESNAPERVTARYKRGRRRSS